MGWQEDNGILQETLLFFHLQIFAVKIILLLIDDLYEKDRI